MRIIFKILTIFIIAIIIIILILIPFITRETIMIDGDSMSHGNEPTPETLDLGDTVEIIPINSKEDIVTYVQGKKTGYKTFGNYGDVIVYYKNNDKRSSVVIHRAIVWLEYNASGHYYYRGARYNGSFDIPSLPPSEQYDRHNYTIPNFKPNNINLEMDFAIILENFRTTGRAPHSGFITKGDNNPSCDQGGGLRDSFGNPVEPVKPEWIKGKAEKPWFANIFLISGLIAIIIIAIISVIIIIFKEKKRIKSQKTMENIDYTNKRIYIRNQKSKKSISNFKRRNRYT